MKLHQNHNNDVNIIKTVNDQSIVINDKTIQQSCIISNNELISDLDLHNIGDLSAEHIDKLLLSRPEIIIFGSGTIHTFPAVELLEPIAVQNVGFEVMNNKSAARTYNILVAEDRKVACLLIV